MLLKGNSIRGIIARAFGCTVVLFLISCPVAYLDLLATVAGKNIPFSYLILRLIRFSLAVFIGYKLRVNNHAMIAQNEPMRKRVLIGIAAALLLAGVLIFTRFGETVYMTLTYRLGLSTPPKSMYFWAISWEQLFSGDLFWSILACVSVAFFKNPIKKFPMQKVKTGE